MVKEIENDMKDASVDAVKALKQYFRSAVANKPGDGAQVEETDKKLPDRALIMLGRANGMESTRIKGIALQFQIAKYMGLKGEPLRPLLAELSSDNFAGSRMRVAGGESPVPDPPASEGN